MVNMGQMSVMVAGTYGMMNKAMPQGGMATPGVIITTIVLTIITLLIVLFGGFKRLVKVMTGLLMLILVCFIIVAIKGLFQWQTWVGLVGGLVPQIPADVNVVGSDSVRGAFTQLMGIAMDLDRAQLGLERLIVSPFPLLAETVDAAAVAQEKPKKQKKSKLKRWGEA